MIVGCVSNVTTGFPVFVHNKGSNVTFEPPGEEWFY